MPATAATVATTSATARNAMLRHRARNNAHEVRWAVANSNGGRNSGRISSGSRSKRSGRPGTNATPTPSNSISAGHGSRSRSPTPTSSTAASISPTTRTRICTAPAFQARRGLASRGERVRPVTRLLQADAQRAQRTLARSGRCCRPACPRRRPPSCTGPAGGRTARGSAADHGREDRPSRRRSPEPTSQATTTASGPGSTATIPVAGDVARLLEHGLAQHREAFAAGDGPQPAAEPAPARAARAAPPSRAARCSPRRRRRPPPAAGRSRRRRGPAARSGRRSRPRRSGAPSHAAATSSAVGRSASGPVGK